MIRFRGRALFLPLVLAVAACAASGGNYPKMPDSGLTDLHLRLIEQGNADPSLDSLVICHGYGCSSQTEASLSPEEWQSVAAYFDPLPPDAAAERAALREAIGQMERIIGSKTGTDQDAGGTFLRPFGASQMDCEDEMLNTGTYLRLMKQKGLIRHHRIAGIANRGAFLDGWPHMAVRIQDVEVGAQFVLDSWFHDNGHPAEIVQLDLWQEGWKPGRNQVSPNPPFVRQDIALQP